MASPRPARLAAHFHWKPAVVTLAALGVWLLLGLANPGTTYHFAPLIVAAAGPVSARLERETPLEWPETLVLGAGSVSTAALGLAVLWAFGALDGPAVVGGNAPAETAIAIAVGAAVGPVVGRFPGRAPRGATPSGRDRHS